jgi:hypothetical protein
MTLSNKEFTSVTLPNTLMALYTAAWMQEFFRLTGNYIRQCKYQKFNVTSGIYYLKLCLGDQVPNSDGQIHLEKQLKKDIWKEYVDDFEYRCRPSMSYTNFCKLWQSSFPHVKIREYKQVSGNKTLYIMLL